MLEIQLDKLGKLVGNGYTTNPPCPSPAIWRTRTSIPNVAPTGGCVYRRTLGRVSRFLPQRAYPPTGVIGRGGSNSTNQPNNYIPNLTEPDLLNFNLV